MTFAAASSAVVVDLSGHVIRVEADLSPGRPGFHLVGLPEASAACTRDRVRAAIVNSGWTWPEGRVTVTVLPGGMPSYGSFPDLAIAVAILAADGKIPTEQLENTGFVGELGLDGTIRHVRGLSYALNVLVMSGIRCVAIPAASASGGSRCAFIAAESLTDLVGKLTNGATTTVPSSLVYDPPPLDLADVPAGEAARRALEISAAGGHHLLLIGNGPATMLAECLLGILPNLDQAGADEVGRIYAMTPTARYSRRPPLCAPHYTNTAAAIFGGYSAAGLRPGAVSLAHRGVLFLDQAPEFARSILYDLRHPLDTGEVVLLGGEGIVRLPARFQLVAASSPCPCGGSGNCACSPAERRRYLDRLTALRDQIEIAAPVDQLHRAADPGEATASVAVRVSEARARTAHRLSGTPWRTNAEVPSIDLRSRYRLDPDALDPLENRLRAGVITPRILTSMLRLSWTLADLRAAARPSSDDTRLALRLWQGEIA